MHEFLEKELTKPNRPLEGLSIKKVDCLANNSTHQAWYLKVDNGTDFFAKTTRLKHSKRLVFEFEGLKALRKFSDSSLLIVPTTFLLEDINNYSILLLPWIESHKGSQVKLAKGLAKLHKYSQEENTGKFGWDTDGFIGIGYQEKGWGEDWGGFFFNKRLTSQINLSKNWGLDIDKESDFKQMVIDFLNINNPEPSLVHGDFWNGNFIISENNKGAIFDPAAYWGHSEVDIAMSKLFGGFSKDFYEEYHKLIPTTSESDIRTKIYNLYHILNHANIFGGTYKVQSIEYIKDIQKDLK